MSSCLLIMILLYLLLCLTSRTSQNECREVYCGPDGPPIRFPFHLINSNTNHCGYPGFGLSCSDQNETLLELPASPSPLKFIVQRIDYQYQKISLNDPQNCLTRQFLKLNHSTESPFEFGSFPSETQKIPFFDCSSVGYRYPTNSEVEKMSSCPIIAAAWDESVVDLDLVLCSKMFDVVSSADARFLRINILILSWSKPYCGKCEAKGKMCKLKNKGSGDDTECLNPETRPTRKKRMRIIFAATGVTVGSILLIMAMTALFFKIYRFFRMKGEDHARIENFLDNYKALKPTRFSYADVKRITNNFKDKLGEGAHGTVVKGTLSKEILVAVKMLNNTSGDGEEFINEVRAMGKIHHVNIVRLLGFCADGFHRALIYDLFSNGSLQKFISRQDNKNIFLGWDKLQEIALGIAKGIEYLHLGCDHQILHFDINPHNVLLDVNFTPKISDFGLAKFFPKNRSIVSISAARGTLGYMAPEIFSRNFGNISFKADIYSFGMLLLEIIGGRKNIDTSANETFQVLYPEWIHNLLEGDMHIHIEDERDINIAKKLAIVGLWCIQWNPVGRPCIKSVVQMLEGEIDKLKQPPCPFESSYSNNTSTITSAKRIVNLELEVIREFE